MTILLLEDDDLDAELISLQLAEALPGLPTTRVTDKHGYAAALATGDVQLIVSDFSLPDFDGSAALQLARRQAPGVPFIFVSGVLGEELATAALKGGATDYVMKQRLDRLGAAALRALNEAQARLQHKRTLDALRDSEERFRVMADSAPALIWSTDAQGELTFANRHFEVMFAQPRTVVLSRGWRGLLVDADQPAFFNALQRAISERAPFQIEARMLDAIGETRWLKCEGAAQLNGAGQLLGYSGVNIDITEARLAKGALETMVQQRTAQLIETNVRLRREVAQREEAEHARVQVEEQLRQAQKMEAFGQLTGGVAHDFNNLLTVILGNIETLERRLGGLQALPDGERIGKAIRHAKQGAQRAASLTERLLAFARRQPLRPQRVDANQLVTNMSDLLMRTLGEQVEIRTTLAEDLWPTRADAPLLENALLNLAVNARDAMPSGGCLSIHTSNTVVQDQHAGPRDLEPGEYVMMSIVDNGSGIPPEIMEKVFEPFFTTKDVGAGTGLGLSQVYGFVRQSGGHIHLQSELGVGTRIDLYLPRLRGQEAPAVQPAAEETTVLDGRRDEVILVVEDDPAVRAHSTAILHDLGYSVIEAAEAHSALRIVATDQPLSLLFTDVGLPQAMNGRELALAVRALRPTLPVLFTSGYAEGALAQDGRMDDGVVLLSKPYTFAMLAKRVRALIDTAPALEPARVLLVEDDPSIRMITSESLAETGITVREAATAKEALAALAPHAQEVDAVILDLGLPDMRGDELARRLLALRADLPIVIASGFISPELSATFPAGARMRFLQKPYPIVALRNALTELGVR